jgi:hypothetical protein
MSADIAGQSGPDRVWCERQRCRRALRAQRTIAQTEADP